MLRYLPVRKVHARQVLDSRGNPTVEAEVTVGEGIVGINGYTGRAMVPSGASTGKFEAVELRDENREEYLGQSVKKAVENINTRLADAIIGENALNQAWIDHLLIEPTERRTKAVQEPMPRWQYLWQQPVQQPGPFGFLFISIWAAVIPCSSLCR